MDRILILGGTGSLGRCLIKHLHGNNEITVLSRDEHKQQALSKIYPDVKFVLGDIKDKDSIRGAFRNKDAVYHVAALKHVNVLEDNPFECLKVNTIASFNVADLCLENGIKTCMYSSTDKAVYPINTYGYCKAISEKIFQNYNEQYRQTVFNVYRWPNVIGSTGSVIPFFVTKLRNNEIVPITDYRMTRFFVKLEDAVRFVLETNKNIFRPKNTIIYPDLRSASIVDIVSVLAKILNVTFQTHEVGLRKGEKMHEDMIAEHEGKPLNSLNAPKFSRDELKEMLGAFCQS